MSKTNKLILIVLSILLLTLTSCTSNRNINEEIINEILKQIEELNITNQNLKPIEINTTIYHPIDLKNYLKNYQDAKIIFNKPFNSYGIWTPKEKDIGKYLVKVKIIKDDKIIVKPFLIVVKKENKTIKSDKIVNLRFKAKEGQRFCINKTLLNLTNAKVFFFGYLNDFCKNITYNDAGIKNTKIIVKTNITTIYNITLNIQDINRRPIVKDIILIKQN